MMQRRSPPKHRHDGTSPLPLGMDWSPPPRKWSGRDTVWPHDPTSGWSYCVTIPSWVVLPKSRDSDPVVFYRVQVGVQSPEGVTSMHGVLRRFNDFLKLFTDLKKAFPKKSLPPAPPKGLLHMKTRALLEERRCSLQDWMTKLLSDIDLSRSVAVASFLELEAAARSSFQDVNQHSSEASPTNDSTTCSLQTPPSLSSSLVAGSTSVASDYGSDTAYETSELGTPRFGRDGSFEVGVGDLTLDEDLSSPIEKLVKYGMSNIDEGLFMGQTILEQLEGFPRHKPNVINLNNVTGKVGFNGNASKASFLLVNGMELFSDPERGKVIGHARKFSSESLESEGSSIRGSDLSNSGMPTSSANRSLELPGVSEISNNVEIVGNTEPRPSGGTQIILPLDQRHKMNRVLLTMERRLVTARTDMEDLIARLNQEVAVKDYLTTKVTDLEVELEATKQKNKENLQQAILIERERLTQMQWDMEELRRKSLEMELKLKAKEDGKSTTELKAGSMDREKDATLQELDSTRKQLESLSKQYEELEAKSKADIKFLAKEFKSLNNSHTQLKQHLSQSEKDKSEAEKLLQEERERSEREKIAREKLLDECEVLRCRFQECDLNLFSKDGDNFPVDEASLTDALDLLTTSDNEIRLLLVEVQQLSATSDGTSATDDKLSKTLKDILGDNAKLRKQVNSVLHHAFKSGVMSMNNKVSSVETNHAER